MANYTIEIPQSEVDYLQNCDFENLLDDMQQICDLIDSLNIEDHYVVYE